MKALLVALAIGLGGCGYHLANAPGATDAAVELGRVSTPHADVAAALLAGARAEIARTGLRPGDAGRLEVDLVAVEERAAGVVAIGGDPRARGVRVIVAAEARLVRDGQVVRASGVLREEANVASGAGPATSEGVVEAAVRLAARRLGARLSRRIHGFPEPNTSP